MQFAARVRATQPGRERVIGQETGDHGNVSIMTFVQLLWQDETEDQIDRHAVRGVEIHRLGNFHQGPTTGLYARYAAMGERDALVEAGTAEPFSFNELGKDLFVGNIGIRIRQQFAQYFEAVLFAACVHIAQDTAGADKLFQYHER